MEELYWDGGCVEDGFNIDPKVGEHKVKPFVLFSTESITASTGQLLQILTLDPCLVQLIGWWDYGEFLDLVTAKTTGAVTKWILKVVDYTTDQSAVDVDKEQCVMY